MWNTAIGINYYRFMVFSKKKKEGGSLNEVRFKQELLKKATNNFYGTHQMCGGLKQCSVSRIFRRVLRRKRRWFIDNQPVSAIMYRLRKQTNLPYCFRF